MLQFLKFAFNGIRRILWLILLIAAFLIILHVSQSVSADWNARTGEIEPSSRASEQFVEFQGRVDAVVDGIKDEIAQSGDETWFTN